MPSATTTKSKVAGTKRKAESVREPFSKDSKKTKTVLPSQPVSGKKTKAVAESVDSEDLSDDELNGSDSDGGVQLEESSESENDSQDERSHVPKVQDGVHPDRVKAAKNSVTANSTSREAHAKQKQQALERKNAKPLSDELTRTKKIWERLRIKSRVEPEERKKLVMELFGIITGRIKEFVLKHDAVRTIQTAIKYANPEQKRMIAQELKGTYRELAESRYAKFLIGKLLVQGDDEIRDLIVPEFYGHVRRMIKHPEASWILDDVYRGIATRHQKAVILREWYGAEFAIFQKDAGNDVTGELSEILEKNPEKKTPIMRSLLELINQLIQKKTTGFTLLHDAMLQYFLNVKQGTEEMTDYLELIKGDEEGDLLKNLAFTKSGARVVSLSLAYGTAKDRKQILRTYKDTIQLMAADPNGHIVILAAYEVIDDTVLTAKSIFPELLGKDAEKQIENIMYSVNNLYARTTLLYLFQGQSTSLFPASLASDLKILSEIDDIRVTTSKKEPDTRRQELVKALSPHLLTAIATAGGDLVSTSFGCQFITEVLFGAEGDKSAALQAVAATAAGDPNALSSEPKVEQATVSSEQQTGSKMQIAQSPFGGKMLKSLVAGGRFNPKTKQIVPITPPLNFADLLHPIIKDHVIAWATSPSSFVVLSMLETENFSHKAELLKKLKSGRKELEKAATEQTPEQKAKAQELAQKEAAQPSAKGKKTKSISKAVLVGNMGAKMLLEKLK